MKMEQSDKPLNVGSMERLTMNTDVAGASPVEREVRPQTHDYTRRTWGHDYRAIQVIDGGMRLRLAGWGHGVKAGDYLILPNGSETTRYEVASINYRTDPPDMWFADAVFAPRHVTKPTLPVKRRKSTRPHTESEVEELREILRDQIEKA